MIQRSVDEAGTLIVEWDNRRIAKSKFLTVLFPLSWAVWVAMTVYWTCEVAMDEPGIFRSVIGCIAFVIACAVAVGMPATWLMRSSKERVEISSVEYYHCFTRFPRLCSKKWRTADITAVEIGKHVDYDEPETIVTLSVWQGKKRDILGYWIGDELKYEIFQIVTEHLRSNGHGFRMVDEIGRRS